MDRVATRKVIVRARTTQDARRKRWRLLWLGLATLLSTGMLSCGESGTEPRTPRSVHLPLRVVFSSSDSIAFAAPMQRPALISEIIARAYDLGENGALRAEARVELDPSDTRFELTLSVPPANYYQIDVRALGTRMTDDLSTEFGLLYSGVGFAMDVSSGDADTVEIVLDELVPRLGLEALTDSYRLIWTRIDGAIGYRLRETSNSGSVERLVAGQDTTIAFPPTLAGGQTRSYRVAAVVEEGELSAFSEPVSIEIPGPIAPGAVTDLRGGTITPTSVELQWTAPGDDGSTGTATSYEVRRHGELITEDNFGDATLVAGVSAPLPGGSDESFVVEGLDPETPYFFALRAFDDVPLASPLSNVISVTTAPLGDNVPPDPVTDLAASVVSETMVDLTWTASGDDGNTGRSTRIDLRHATLPITADNFSSAASVTTKAPLDPGQRESLRVTGLAADTQHFFAMLVFDEEDNASPLSNVAQATTPDSTAPAGITDLSAVAVGEEQVRLLWTAPGDDGSEGTASEYEIRYAATPIDEETWDGAIEVSNPPVPRIAGTPEETVVGGLTRESTYHFAVRARDNAGNLAPVSNSPMATTLDTIPPAPVGDLRAESFRTFVRLTWTAPGDDGDVGQAAVYDFRFSEFEINAGNFEQATNLTVPSPQPAGANEELILEDFDRETTYYFALRAADTSANISSISNIASTIGADVTPPEVITTLSIIGISWNSVTLQWIAPGDDGREGQATEYDLRYATFVLNEDTIELGTRYLAAPDPGLPATVESVEVTGLSSETTYYFAIRTLDDADNLASISNVTEATTYLAPPDAPTGLTALTVTDTEVELAWNDVATEDHYYVERSEVGGEYALVGLLKGAVSGTVVHIDIGLTERTDYLYRVRADNVSGFSDYSNEIQVRTGIAPPMFLVATPVAPDSIHLTWTFGPDPEVFRIEQHVSPGGEWTEVGVVQGIDRSYGAESLQPLTEYGFRIRAQEGDALSSYSAEAMATTPDLAPSCFIDPPSLDFGDVAIGSSADRSFTIQNVGGGILIGSVAEFCSEFSIVSGEGSFGLANDDKPITVVVRFQPQVEGPQSCEILTGGQCAQVSCAGEGFFSGTWWPGFSDPPSGQGVNGEVRALHVFNGQLAVGGIFDQVGPLAAPYVARWSGMNWNLFGSGLPGPVYAFGEAFGQIIAGGAFSAAGTDASKAEGHERPAEGGYSPNILARWIEPSFWEGFSQVPDAPVRAIYTFPESLVVGGEFVHIDQQLFDHVGVFYDSFYFPIGTIGRPPGVDGVVLAITQLGSELFVGGSFTRAGGTVVSNIARWNGSIWRSVGSGVDGTVFALREFDGSLYAAGDFATAGAASARGIARWDGADWSALGSNLDFRTVQALGEFNGALIAGGNFVLSSPSGDLDRIAEWTGTEWRPLGSGIGNGAVEALEEFQGSLYVGGTFTIAGEVPSVHLARWDPTTASP